MEEELLQQIEPLARLLLSPGEIGAILGLTEEQVNDFASQYSAVGQLYRRVLAERARDLHEKTLRLADVGSPTAIDEANRYLRIAQNAIE